MCVVGGMHDGGGHVWQGTGISEQHTWQGVHSRRHVWKGRDICMAAGMLGRGACMAGACVAGGVWQGLCVTGHVWQGACVAGETATAADGTHPTGTHSCNRK